VSAGGGAQRLAGAARGAHWLGAGGGAGAEDSVAHRGAGGVPLRSVLAPPYMRRAKAVEQWIHIRSSNVIESSFATIRHQTDRTKGCLTRGGMLAMIYKLGQAVERGWRRLRGFEWLAKVVEGVKFSDGIEVKMETRVRPKNQPSRVAA
jgi:hypothetical protein